MEYGILDSSGTDDDNPQTLHNRSLVGGCVAGNGRSYIKPAQFQRIQIDMEYEIHNLEQIAYGAVLRAFKAQSDALTWEKEGLITELRKELRVSDDEHRKLLGQVNGDDLIHRIREWREAGGNVALVVHQHVNNQLTSSTVPASRKRQKTSLSVNPFGVPSQSVPGGTLPLSSVVKRGPSFGVGGRKLSAGQPAFSSSKPIQYQFGDHISSGGPMDDPSESIDESLVGRRVMIRWPEDSNFYEAIISEYNPVDGRHSLVYDCNTHNETVELVNIKEVPPEDIRWVGEHPVISQLGEAGRPNAGRRITPSTDQYAKEMQPSRNGITNDDSEEIEILHTQTLIKKVETVLEASHPDALEIDKAKRMLKEHEQTLVQVIQKLTDACQSDEEQQHNTDYHGPNNEVQIAGRTGSSEMARG